MSKAEEKYKASMEDMVSELVSGRIGTLAQLAVSDYAEFEAQLFPYLKEEYDVHPKEQVAELYLMELGVHAQGWEEDHHV